MPYCPKCDMEFVEGIKVCSDCGGPLVESKEVAEAMKKKEQEEQLAAMAQEMDPFSGEGTDTEFSGDNPPEKSSPAAEPVHAYVDKGQRYDDMSSSASAFFLVGGVLAIGAALCLLGIFHLPMAGFQKYMFEGVLVVLAIGSFVVAVSSRKRAAELKVEADDEKRQTQEIINWFLKNYSAKELDEQLLMEDPDLSGEELSLKRFELIQDFLKNTVIGEFDHPVSILYNIYYFSYKKPVTEADLRTRFCFLARLYQCFPDIIFTAF